jgi:hypothetical protein
MSLAILRNEQETFDALVAFVEREGVDCDLWKGQSLEVAMSPGGFCWLSSSGARS